MFLEPHQLRKEEESAPGGVMVFDVVVKECNLAGSLPEVKVAGLPDLYLAYRKVFDREAKAPEKAVVDLLHVIMAAQQPLSLSLLQQMGLAQHLPALPGWPTLFFKADHHVST